MTKRVTKAELREAAGRLGNRAELSAEYGMPEPLWEEVVRLLEACAEGRVERRGGERRRHHEVSELSRSPLNLRDPWGIRDRRSAAAPRPKAQGDETPTSPAPCPGCGRVLKWRVLHDSDRASRYVDSHWGGNCLVNNCRLQHEQDGRWIDCPGKPSPAAPNAERIADVLRRVASGCWRTEQGIPTAAEIAVWGRTILAQAAEIERMRALIQEGFNILWPRFCGDLWTRWKRNAQALGFKFTKEPTP